MKMSIFLIKIRSLVSSQKVLLLGQSGLEEGVFTAGPVICSDTVKLHDSLAKLTNKIPPLLKAKRQNGAVSENNNN